MDGGSEDTADPDIATRVGTLMLAKDYLAGLFFIQPLTRWPNEVIMGAQHFHNEDSAENADDLQ